MNKAWVGVVLLAGCAAIAGCGGPGYGGRTGLASGGISPRSQWRISGDVLDPLNAIDGNTSTAALAEGPYKRANLTIDLGKVCLFNMVVVDHGARQEGHCRRLSVQTSDDGQHFTRQAEAPGLRRVTTILLPRQVLARYVRLEVVEAGEQPWAVGEVYLN